MRQLMHGNFCGIVQQQLFKSRTLTAELSNNVVIDGNYLL